ncbi:hypothetical protein [Streptomyces sp. DSM 40907]|uniref:hypothetical protein n=1 Tax=Streptomyces kutzneri TaxID=3051179 RepID=UPI0028D74429|nr:hypothetical protein [Streptomyces sp. DSM 40907]
MKQFFGRPCDRARRRPPRRRREGLRHLGLRLRRPRRRQRGRLGQNTDGQLGDGTKANRTTPVPLDHLKGVQDVDGGADFTLAALDDGSVIGWGANVLGQLGDGTTTAATSPTNALPPGSQITHVSATLTGKSGFAY